MRILSKIAVALLAAVAVVAVARTATAQSATTVRNTGGGFEERIKLRGQWVIEVREPDGKVVRRVEFKNALTPSGKSLLINLPYSFGGIGMTAAFDGGPGGAALCGGTTGVCQLFEGAFPFGQTENGVDRFSDLTISVIPTGGLTLTGSFTVTAATGGTIARVSTSILFSGTSLTSTSFTEAALPTPIAVAQGRIVAFTYTLTFS